jgi:putative transposase
MGEFNKLSHVLYQCKYRIVWCPKYRYRVLKGQVKTFVEETLKMLCEWKKIEIIELNVRIDHIHVILAFAPKYSISQVMGILKGKTAIKLFKTYPGLKVKPYWGNHFWARGYCVSTIGIDEEKIRKYVKYQEEMEKREERRRPF